MSEGDGRIERLNPALTKPSGYADSIADGLRSGSLAVLRDGRLACADSQRNLLVFDLTQPGASPVRIGGHESVTALQALPDGRLVSIGDKRDRRILIWNPDRPGVGPIEIARLDSEVTAVAVLPDGRLVTGGSDHRVLLWDTNGRGRSIPAGDVPHTVRTLHLLADGRVIAVADGGRNHMWDYDSEPVDMGILHRPGHAGISQILPDGQVVSTNADAADQSVWVWNPDSPGEQSVPVGFKTSPPPRILGRLPDGRIISEGGLLTARIAWWTLAYEESQFCIWDRAARNPLQRGNPEPRTEPVALLPDGRILAKNGDWLVLWDLEKDSPPVRLDYLGVGRNVTEIRVFADGKVAWTEVLGTYVKVRDPLGRGKRATSLGPHRGWVRTFVPYDDDRIVTADDFGWHLWDVNQPLPITSVACNVSAVAVRRTSRGLIVAIGHAGEGVSYWHVQDRTAR